MFQALPFREVEWLSEEQLREAEAALTCDDLLTTVRFLDSNTRYIYEFVQIQNFDGVPNPPAREDIKLNTAFIFEVDLEYPANVHDRDDEYPLAFKLLEIKRICFSKYNSACKDFTTVSASSSIDSSCAAHCSES